ncbi:hypothetical protein [Amycolatopsis sp. NPDC059021]|uniref:hypothetical protein n=1 Tax=Amycolatopsis sp. NPDC059021 TaxID=3346704 RepID=UPI00366E75B7
MDRDVYRFQEGARTWTLSRAEKGKYPWELRGQQKVSDQPGPDGTVRETGRTWWHQVGTPEVERAQRQAQLWIDLTVNCPWGDREIRP